MKKNKDIKIKNITNSGIEIIVDEKNYFIDYKDYPSLAGANELQIKDVRIDKEGNLHWPLIDEDIELEALNNPKYTLKYKN